MISLSKQQTKLLFGEFRDKIEEIKLNPNKKYSYLGKTESILFTIKDIVYKNIQFIKQGKPSSVDKKYFKLTSKILTFSGDFKAIAEATYKKYLAYAHSPEKIDEQSGNSITLNFVAILLGYLGLKGFIEEPQKTIAGFLSDKGIKTEDIENEKLKEERGDIERENRIDKSLFRKVDEINSLIREQSSNFNTLNDFIIGNRNLITEILATRSDSKEMSDDLLNKEKDKSIKKASYEPDKFLKGVFNDILEKDISKSPNLQSDINFFFGSDPSKIKYDWPHRAVLASALSLSILNRWDWHTVNFLKNLAEKVKEPLVSERAIIGLTIALIVSYDPNNLTDFNSTIEVIGTLRDDVNFKAGVFESLYFFLKEWNSLEIDPADAKVYSEVIREGYQCFEPPHPNVSYIQLQNLKLDKKHTSNDFFELLSGSISLTYFDKMRVLLELNRHKEEQNTELISIFSEEKLKFKEIEKDWLYDVLSFKYKRELESFKAQIVRFANSEKYENLIVNVLEKTDSDCIASAIFDNLPYHRYIKLLPEKEKLIVDCLNYIDPLAYLDLGILLYELSRKKEALIAYDKAVKANPKLAEAWYRKGIILYELSRKEKALIAVDKAVNTKSTFANAWYMKGALLYELGRKEEALIAYDNAVNANPKLADAWYNKGVLLYELGRKEEALIVYDKAVKANPRNRVLRHSLGWGYFELKQVKKAKEQFEIILNSDEKHKLGYMNLSHCQLILKNKKEAITNYKKSLDLCDCSQEFFDGFDDDFQYIELQGVPKEEYQKIKEELQQYCQDKDEIQ